MDLATRKRQRLFQISLREICALATIVGLAIALYFTRVESRRLGDKLGTVLETPRLILRVANPEKLEYLVTSPVGITGDYFSNDTTIDVLIKVRMLDPETRSILAKEETLIASNSFAITLAHKQFDPKTNAATLPPAFYPIVAEAWVKQECVATTISGIKYVGLDPPDP